MNTRRCLLVISLAVALFINPVSGQSATLRGKAALVDLNVSNTNLNEVLAILKSQSDYDFFYDKEAAKKLRVDKLAFAKVSVLEALKKMRQMLPLEYEVLRNEISVRIETPEQFNRRKAQEQPGKITGRVLDEKGETLPGASIKIIQTSRVLQSNADGFYQVSLEPGTYTIEVSYIGFQTKRITEVIVKPGQNTPLDVLLTMDAKSLNAVVITSTYRMASIEGLYARQKNNATVSDGITAEQISRTPDNNSAQVLKRVSGLQITQNKYVVVRGLSDRYNNVLLNGAPLPSSEPNRRDFAFDMVPSALVDNIVVNKTATPDLTGEFAGGLVQVNTKDIPEENFFQVNIGAGYNSRATGKDFIGLERSKYAYFGFGDDQYKKPGGMTFQNYNGLISKIEDPNNVTERKQAADFLSSIPGNWKMMRYTAKPIQAYQFSLGRNIPMGNSRLGIIAALTYRNEQEADMNDQYQPTLSDYKGTDYTFTTTLGGSLNLAYTAGRNKFTFKNTYNRKFSDGLFFYSGENISAGSGSGAIDTRYSNVTVINQLFQSQLGGEHTFSKYNVKLDWSGSIADLDRDQPFNKIMYMTGGDNGYYSYSFSDLQPDLGSIYYSELREKMYNWALNVQVPFKLFKLNQSFKAGYQGRYRTADFGADFYRLRSLRQASGAAETFEGWAYYDVYNSANFANSQLYLYPIAGTGSDATRGAGTGYQGFQRLNAFYAMLDIKPFEKLRLVGGIRAEKNDQNVHTNLWQTGGGRKDSLINVDKTDWLPSVNAIYALTPKMNIRAAYYKTVARPDLRELSTFQYFDFNILRSIGGNSLKTTDIQNVDLRFEFYPAPGELISISGFSKRFFNPIELLMTSTSGKPVLEYKNLASAKDVGFEFDFRKSLSFFSQSSAFWKNLYLSGSFTWLDASVEFQPELSFDPATGENVTPKRNRPLYGQSPYIINGGILYAGKHFGLNATYNRYGKRIIYGSVYMSGDEYENPRDVVDLQLSYKFLKEQRAEFRLNISDLLNQELFLYQNQFGRGNSQIAEGKPSVPAYPEGPGSVLPEGQQDPKGTAYSPYYDSKTIRKKSGTTYSLNFIYRF